MTNLADYPRPHLAIDLVILTVGTPRSADEHPSLGVVVQRRDDGTAVLPGRFVRERHTVTQTVRELMTEKLSYQPRGTTYLEMLGVYDAPHRDERGWVVSVSHLTTLRPEEVDLLSPGTVETLPIRGDASRGRRVTREALAYDHGEMVTTAVRRTRRRYERSPDPLHLIRPPYTLSQLRKVHEAVLGEPLKRDTFNRRMQPYLQPVTDARGEVQLSDTGGRPAQLFQPFRRKDSDPEAGPFPLPRTTR
ncbi:NrtR DNA-binding winged helix domain-containing protein [Nocardioides salsibiostraticola]